MRILNTTQIRELDAYTISHEPIASIDLMERASRAFCDWFFERFDISQKVHVVCGTGNNGGDGLAITRMLNQWGYSVTASIVRGGAESPDFKINEGRLPSTVVKDDITELRGGIADPSCDVLIDALFGSGLSRPLTGLYAQVIASINEVKAVRIAVDLPSGLMADAHSQPPIVKAHYTVTFQLPKLAFMLPECYQYTGEWHIVDIGLSKEFIRQCTTPSFYTRGKDVRPLLRLRSKFDHKGSFGHALLIAGSQGKMGAAVLAAQAALRAGVGLLSVHAPLCGYNILQTSVPEAMVEIDVDQHVFTSLPAELGRYDAIGLGPGLGQEKRTAKALAETMANFGKPVVLDADALNMIAADRALQSLIPPGSILTPHPREFQRLVGEWANDFERLAMLRELAVSLKVVVVLKGAHSAVANERGEVFFNSTGNPGMATGGTGDVLTGVLTGLLAQNYSPCEAAVLGVYVHGLAGDEGISEQGMVSLVASDLIAFLPRAFIKMLRKSPPGLNF